MTIPVCLRDEIRQSTIERISVLATHLYTQFNRGVEELRPFIVVRFAYLYCQKHIFAHVALFNLQMIMVALACGNSRELQFLLT
jgi:hypothetical protein